MNRSLMMVSLTVCALTVLTGCANKTDTEEAAPAATEPAPVEVEVAAPRTATAKFASHDGAITGMVTFTEAESGVEIVAHVEGAPPGAHGFHIHEVGDCSADDFTSAGGHFNPGGAPHGAPTDADRHAGDLGNIEIDEAGAGHLSLSSDLITVGAGPSSVVDRGIILHAGTDDLETQPTGAAGARLACGVVNEG